MRDVERMQEKIEIALEQRQVALLAIAAFVLLAVVFAAGVQVGRQIAGSAAAAPVQPPPDDLVALDHAQDEGAAGAAAKVAPKQPPTRAELPPEPAPAITPLVEAKPERAEAAAPEQAEKASKADKIDKPTPVAAVEPVDDDPEEAPAPPGTVRVAMVAAPSTAHAVVAKPPDDDVRLTQPPKSLGSFTVQIGASQDKRDALRLEAKARSGGLKPYSVEADLGAKGLWYRVRVGAFANKDVAQRYKQDVERELRLFAMVMPTK